jgi:SAM-dependent methyltransferase
MERERRSVFGEAAEQYASARADYPDALVDDVIGYSRELTHVLEVGAGTGKATLAFASRGYNLTCLEPDPRMAELLARACAPFPKVSVVVAQLEKWTPPLRYDLLIAAQSWHWVDAERRWDLAYKALASSGSIALYWNQYIVSNEELRLALLDIDVRFEVQSLTFHQHGAHEFADEVEVEKGWPAFDLKGDHRFGDLTSHRYRRSQSYATSTYLDLLSSTSAYRMLDDDKRVQLLDEVAGIVNAAGGRVELLIVTDLFLGRTNKAR